MAISNAAYEKAFLKAYPNYKQYTSGVTASVFKDNGFLDTILSDVAKLNEVYNALNRITLNVINISQAVDSFDIGDFGENFDSEYAAGVQRIAIYPMKPTSPKFKNLPKGGVNQQAVRIPKIEDRYFKINFDFQNFYTIQEYQIRQMFVSEYGISEFYAGFMAQMTNSYIEQKHINTLECLNALINSATHPLQDTQKIVLKSWTETDGFMTPTSTELIDFIQRIKNVVSHMNATTSTSAYNALGFKTHQDVSRLRLLCRVGIKNLIDTEVMVGAYNPERVSLPFDIIEVENFGGLVPIKNIKDTFTGDGTEDEFELTTDEINGNMVVKVGGTATTAYTYADGVVTFDSAPAASAAIEITYDAKVFPVYATSSNTDMSVGEGEQIGWSLTEDDTTVAYKDSEIDYYDPNANVLAVLADKGAVFSVNHNAPRMISAPYNAAGLYVTQWFSVPANEIHGDALYTLLTINAPVSNSVSPISGSILPIGG